MTSQIIDFIVIFFIFLIALTIFYSQIKKQIKSNLREKNLKPIISIKKIGGKFTVTFKHGCQTFNLYPSIDEVDAEFLENQLKHFFNDYKNDIIDEI